MHSTAIRTFASVLGLSLLMAGCKERPNPDVPSEPGQNIPAPKQIISNQEAKELFDSYGKTMVPYIEKIHEDQPEFIPTRFISYDYKTLKDYLAYIEQEAKAAGNTEIGSIRIYLAAYPNMGNNTVFLVPTTNFGKEDQPQQGFYVEVDGDGNKKPRPIADITMGGKTNQENTSQQNRASIIPLPAPTPYFAEESLTLNRGQFSPPPGTDF